jgi:hypothetical protein
LNLNFKNTYYRKVISIFFVLFLMKDVRSGRSVVRLSRLLWEQEVAGSNPAAPTLLKLSVK